VLQGDVMVVEEEESFGLGTQVAAEMLTGLLGELPDASECLIALSDISCCIIWDQRALVTGKWGGGGTR